MVHLGTNTIPERAHLGPLIPLKPASVTAFCLIFIDAQSVDKRAAKLELAWRSLHPRVP